MSVLGSQLEIDLDPDGDMTVVPRHVGNTGTGCYKLHDHGIRDTKKMPNIPASEKVEATYMYAPTPDEPEEDPEDPEEEQPPAEAEKNGTLPKPKSGTSSGRASNSRTPPQKRPSHPNSHTPHLLDAPVQPQQPQPQKSEGGLSSALAAQARSPSQKSANASLGVSFFKGLKAFLKL